MSAIKTRNISKVLQNVHRNIQLADAESKRNNSATGSNIPSTPENITTKTNAPQPKRFATKSQSQNV